jgi:hypothetical protein
MIRLIRVSSFVIAAAPAMSNLTSGASAQAFSAGCGTGNVEVAHYNDGGAISQNPSTARPQAASAFATSPRKIHRDRGL